MWLTTVRARQRLAKEKKLFSANSEGEIPICLVYPNRYPVGMSNLGFQPAYNTLAEAYLPELFNPQYDDQGRLTRVDYSGDGEPRVTRRLIMNLDAYPTTSQILTPETVFGDMYLVEASRGCEWGCRFCAAGFMYR